MKLLRRSENILTVTRKNAAAILSIIVMLAGDAESLLYAAPKDSSDLENITIIGQCGVLSGSCYSIFVKETVAFFGDGNTMRIVNVNDPANPVPLSTFSLPGNKISGIHVSGDYAYIANQNDGLHILDIGDLTDPTEVSTVSGWIMDVKIVDEYAYITDYWRGLLIYDVRDPSVPLYTGECNYARDEASAYAIAADIKGTNAYVASCTLGLIVVDISDPAEPAQRGASEEQFEGMGIAVYGDYAYVTDGNYGLRIFDVSVPSYPDEIGFYPTKYASKAAVDGNNAYISSGYEGLRVLNIGDPYHPEEIGRYSGGDFVYDVSVSGGYIFIAELMGGMRVLQLKQNGTFVAEETNRSDRRRFALYQNYPNPFNQSTFITYTVESTAKITITVYNMLGQRVQTLTDEVQRHGRYTVQWDGRDDTGTTVANGVYLYTLQAGNFTEIRSMLLMK